MSRILTLPDIREALAGVDLLAAMERAFVRYSRAEVVVPPVGELLFDNPPGEVHIKYGYSRGDEYYVIKIASGFYENPRHGLPSSNGMMLLFKQATGELQAVLLDEGYLTNQRTAAAGAVAAKYMAPRDVRRIGIIGTGIQAEAQLRHLAPVVACRQVLVCGRNPAALQDYLARTRDSGFELETTTDALEVGANCQLIVTTTPATEPLLHSVLPGTHITAVGSDTPDKQELDCAILAAADVVAVDSCMQAQSRGEVFRALQAEQLSEDRVVELGKVISGESPGRETEQQLTVADLTGVASQDIEIATAVYERISNAD